MTLSARSGHLYTILLLLLAVASCRPKPPEIVVPPEPEIPPIGFRTEALAADTLQVRSGETFNGLMEIPNLIGVFLLSGTVVKLVKNYFSEDEEYVSYWDSQKNA